MTGSSAVRRVAHAKRDFTLVGESPFISSAPLPWLLVVVAAAAVVLWRRRVDGARALVATTGLALAVGMVAVARTVGPAFDYRLRWTYLPAMLGAVIAGWAAWTVVADRWPRRPGCWRPGRWWPWPCSARSTSTGATAGTPQNGNHDAMASITDQVLDEVDDRRRPSSSPTRSTRCLVRGGLVLQLERRGVDVGVEPSLVHEYGRHRGGRQRGRGHRAGRDDGRHGRGHRGPAPHAAGRLVERAAPEEMQALLDEREQLDVDLEAAAGDADEWMAIQERLHEIPAS